AGSSFTSARRPRRVASYRPGPAASSRRTSTRTPRSVDALDIACAAEAGKDLPPLGEIPIPECGPGDQRVGEPRAAAQNPVLLAEEGFRVFRVGEGAEAGIAVESRPRPLPDGSADVLELVGDCLYRLLPLGLGRQALAGPL